MLKYVYFKNQITEKENAKISIATHTLQYGTGVFEGIRGYYVNFNDGNQSVINLVKLKEHYKRLLNSAKILGFKPTWRIDELCEITIQLVKKNSPKTGIYIRPFIYQAGEVISPKLSGIELDLAIYIIELGDYLPTDRGLKGIVSSWRRSSDNSLPCRAKINGLYVNSSLAKSEAIMKGVDEAIFLNEDGTVSEVSAANIFIVRDKKLITPPLTANILEGITRDCIINIAKDNMIEVVERPIQRTELYIADEVLAVGTGVQVAWFSEIDGRKIGDGNQGEISKLLQKIYFDAVQGKIDKYKNWLTEVKI